jgi:hypothetical protein
MNYAKTVAVARFMESCRTSERLGIPLLVSYVLAEGSTHLLSHIPVTEFRETPERLERFPIEA